MVTEVRGLTERQVIGVLMTVNKALVDGISEDRTFSPVFGRVVEDLRRRGLLGFTHGIGVGAMVDEGRLVDLRRESEVRIQKLTDQGFNPPDLDQFPDRLDDLVGTTQFVYDTYVLKGLDVSRKSETLELHIPFGGAVIDFRSNRIIGYQEQNKQGDK